MASDCWGCKAARQPESPAWYTWQKRARRCLTLTCLLRTTCLALQIRPLEDVYKFGHFFRQALSCSRQRLCPVPIAVVQPLGALCCAC